MLVILDQLSVKVVILDLYQGIINQKVEKKNKELN